ncbi:MAG: hypothetical protein ACI4SX_05470, partial [Candidatus Fimenecus sp.]
KGGSGFTAFFDKNPKMKIIIPIILIAISVLVALIIIFTTEKTKIDTTPVNSGDAAQAEVLPQNVRNKEDIPLDGTDVLDDVALSHGKVTAIMFNSEGYYTATVETDNQHYPNLQVGDYLGDSSWIVESITDDSVVISLDDTKVELKY